MGVITEREREKYFAYLDGVADGLNESRNDVNSVLDKIRTEIDKIYEREGNSVDCLNALDELKWFIDKYKAESEN